MGGGAAVDDGVRSQVREPGQGHHEAGGVCSGKTHPNAAASPAHGPSSPAPRERGGGGAGPGATTTKPQSRNQTRGCGTPGPQVGSRVWPPGEAARRQQWPVGAVALTCPGGQVLGVALLQGAHCTEGGLGPAHQVVCQTEGRGEAWAGAPHPARLSQGVGWGQGGQEGGPTRGAGAAQVQGVVQLARRVLQDALGLRGGGPEHCELLVQQPLPQPLLLRLLVGGGDRGG